MNQGAWVGIEHSRALVQDHEPGPASLRERPGDQPLPIPNDSTDIQALVIEDIHARRELGISRYGTPLQAHNGRDALLDAYQEALDLACYLRQAIEERDRPRRAPAVRPGH